MNAARAVWGNDLRNIVRDRTVGVLLVVPLIFLVLLRFGYPLAERQAPRVADHRTLMLAACCLIAGTFPAFMTSFIMLDEKDQGLFAAQRVLPVGPARLLGYRLFVVALLSLIYPLILILGSGLADRSLPTVLVLALLCALGSPVATLFVVATASNKIEGLTLFKGIFFVLVFAALGVAVPGWWTWLTALIPTYWIYVAFDADSTAGMLAAGGAAVAYHLVVLAVAYRRFRRQVF
nr:ABC transporter permease [Micromonospora sp. DSM 115978]